MSFRVEPYSRTCSFGEEVESICIPTAASGIYWLKNSTDGRVTNDAGISRLSFPCQNIYLQCCYTLRGQNFCGKMTTIVMRKLNLNVQIFCLECIRMTISQVSSILFNLFLWFDQSTFSYNNKKYFPLPN